MHADFPEWATFAFTIRLLDFQQTHTISWKWYVMYKKQVHDTFNVCIFNHKMPVKWLKFIGFENKLQNVTLSAPCTTPFVCFSSFHEFNTREYWKVLDFISFRDICVFLYILLTHFLNSFAFCINFQLQHNEHCEGGALGDRKKRTKSTRWNLHVNYIYVMNKFFYHFARCFAACER